MPAAYAHLKFGREVLATLPDPAAAVIRENFDAYALGLHGPDVLFYYRPLFPNKTSAVGYRLHDEPASDFFCAARATYLGRGARPLDRAYLFGFLCHFALDSACHPLVNAKIASSGVTHTEIESSFDRMLLLEDGKEPFSVDLTGHILPTDANADAAGAYLGTDKKRTAKAIRSMKFYNFLLRAPGRIKRGMVVSLLKLSGNYKEMHGMMLPLQKDERCADSDQALRAAFAEGVGVAEALIGWYENFLREGGEAPERLKRNYE